jgi:hypothetical protein
VEELYVYLREVELLDGETLVAVVEVVALLL